MYSKKVKLLITLVFIIFILSLLGCDILKSDKISADLSEVAKEIEKELYDSESEKQLVDEESVEITRLTEEEDRICSYSEVIISISETPLFIAPGIPSLGQLVNITIKIQNTEDEELIKMWSGFLSLHEDMERGFLFAELKDIVEKYPEIKVIFEEVYDKKNFNMKEEFIVAVMESSDDNLKNLSKFYISKGQDRRLEIVTKANLKIIDINDSKDKMVGKYTKVINVLTGPAILHFESYQQREDKLNNILTELNDLGDSFVNEYFDRYINEDSEKIFEDKIKNYPDLEKLWQEIKTKSEAEEDRWELLEVMADEVKENDINLYKLFEASLTSKESIRNEIISYSAKNILELISNT